MQTIAGPAASAIGASASASSHIPSSTGPGHNAAAIAAVKYFRMEERTHRAATTAATGLQAEIAGRVVWACDWGWRRGHKHFRRYYPSGLQWAKCCCCCWLGEGEGKQAMLFITNITSQTPWAYLGSMFANKCSDGRVRGKEKKWFTRGISYLDTQAGRKYKYKYCSDRFTL